MAAPKVDLARFPEMYTKGPEKFTGPFAKRLLTELGLDQTKADEKVVFLDECCGTGIVQKELAALLPAATPANVDLTCLVLADAMIDFTTQRVRDAGWTNARVIKGDVMDTGLPSSHYTHITLTFGPEIFRGARAGYAEMHRMLKPGGRVGTAQWAIRGYVADVRGALATLPAHVPVLPLDHTLQGLYHNSEDRWYDSAWVEKVVASAGFINVNARIIPFTSRLPAHDYLALISISINELMKDHWSQSDRDKYGTMVSDALSTHFDGEYGKTGAATWDWCVTMVTAEKPTHSHRALTGVIENWGNKLV